MSEIGMAQYSSARIERIRTQAVGDMLPSCGPLSLCEVHWADLAWLLDLAEDLAERGCCVDQPDDFTPRQQRELTELAMSGARP